MEIRKASEIPGRPVDISEWNDDVKAFVKTFTFAEQLEFERLRRIFRDETASNEERADAEVSIAMMALVDENGAPLFTEADRAALLDSHFMPCVRIIKMGKRDSRAFITEDAADVR